MNCLISSFNKETNEIIDEALNQAYGEGVIEVIQLNENNLRQRIRLATKGGGMVETVLIILDSDSFALCKDWEDVLKNDQRFHLFESNGNLVDFLNKSLKLQLEWVDEEPEKVEPELNEEARSSLEEYERKINAYIARETSLVSQIKELEERLEMGGYNEDSSEEKPIEPVVDNKEIEALKSEIVELKNEREGLSKELENLEKSKNILATNLKSVSDELSDFKVKYSTQSGLVNSKDREIESLKGKIEALSSRLVKQELSESGENALKEELASLKKDLASKDKDLKSLQVKYKNLEKTNEDNIYEINLLKDKYTSAKEEYKQKEDVLNEKITSLESAGAQVDAVNKEIEEMQSANTSLHNELMEEKSKHQDAENTIVELNTEKLALQNKLEILEKSTSRDTDIEGIMSELTDLRRKYDSIKASKFARLSDYSSFDSSIGLNLLGNDNLNYSNIEFAYAGSTESRKGMYKCILSECSKRNDEDEVILVDISTETSIDYVFEIRSFKAGLPWFEKGGNINPYLSNTCLKNTKVLSIGGTKYINDCYFLTLDWGRILKDLQSLNKNIVIICGDVSNMVGRILHESFSNYGSSSKIYVHGTAIGCRSVITNIRGLSNASKSIICYFEFNKQVQKYVDIASKTCKTVILNNL